MLLYTIYSENFWKEVEEEVQHTLYLSVKVQFTYAEFILFA